MMANYEKRMKETKWEQPLLVSIDRGPKFLLYKNSERAFERRRGVRFSL